MQSVQTKTERKTVIQLNDEFRRSPGTDWFLTSGVRDMGSDFVEEAIQRVAGYDDFTASNDPFGEHDFGVMLVEGFKLFWKIDYYDQDLRFGSPDPRDPKLTRRILTIFCQENTDLQRGRPSAAPS